MSCTKQLDKDNSNAVSISFTVHKSGTYKIHVMVNGKHIKGSPFIKAFEAGNSREVLVMFSVIQQSSKWKLKYLQVRTVLLVLDRCSSWGLIQKGNKKQLMHLYWHWSSLLIYWSINYLAHLLYMVWVRCSFFTFHFVVWNLLGNCNQLVTNLDLFNDMIFLEILKRGVNKHMSAFLFLLNLKFLENIQSEKHW